MEEWFLARKPLCGTVASNVLEFGCGALNIDGCRVGESKEVPASPKQVPASEHTVSLPGKGGTSGFDPNIGRFPANLCLSHLLGCVRVGERVLTNTGGQAAHTKTGACSGVVYGDWYSRSAVLHGDANGNESVPVYRCAPGCPVAELDRQSGDRPGMSGGGNHREGYAGGMFGGIDCQHTARCDYGGASRFFNTFEHDPILDDLTPFIYLPKPSRAERDAGCESLPRRSAGEATGGRKEGSAALDCPRTGAGRTGGARNTHPTVKGIALMRHLCRIVTQPGGLVLDPFAGSGSTIVAAGLEGFRCIGFDLEEQHCEIARARARHHLGGYYEPHKKLDTSEPKPDTPKQGTLF